MLHEIKPKARDPSALKTDLNLIRRMVTTNVS